MKKLIMIINSNSSNAIDNSTLYPCENFTDFIDQRYLPSRNVTCLQHAPKLTKEVYLRVIILAVMSILSLVCNLATIYSIRKNRRKQRSYSAIYTLILHLSVADLLVTIFCMAGDAIWSYNVAWLWGNAACKIFKFLQMFSLYLSTFVLVLIGIDRFVAVRYPMKGFNMSQKFSRCVLLVWMLSFVLATPQVAIFHVAQGPFIEVFTQCVTHGFYTEAWQEQLYASFSLFFMFLLPLAILIITYVSTVITISQSQRKFKTKPARNVTYIRNSYINRKRIMHRAKTKSLRISVVIVAAFLIWWTPYYTMMIIFLFLNPDEHLSDELQSGIFFFGMSNSLVNPLIYGAFHLWPQKQRQGSYQRSDFALQQRSSSIRRKSHETQIPFLSQDSGSKIIPQQQQEV
ncbi:gonadotropin-releasing hormone receptor [Linepithema humile]|uniref:gonadotropin-releasing hormone receptor n=1 Tax=Linepithema humile TaxID=83485 RepID=UPI0006232EF7|nr:PREDICTED: gonadotropin-releasing hormone II receptor [Linepithema humile]XP_012222606.1 PREDICTED: gonadotropin-releasing hormone II receptor [Linepithema humile]XP_012222607.1 PREDICTED: gonadotropin-releasing hormone II receptor [Linepithema humile]XP_012222608.1 PREDICTED: gonadotropin-releasing hormone II receptor [Linepithema humile]XP_012222609.1 PREDICTED: gonadotropin-releasing hormone II receptor [Linepithema humile]XP_012222610.1 PREDICTED: gonadotropin-releasing hormone II recep